MNRKTTWRKLGGFLFGIIVDFHSVFGNFVLLLINVMGMKIISETYEDTSKKL